jgi:hypothetical protein
MRVVDYDGEPVDSRAHRLESVNLKVQAFRLHSTGSRSLSPQFHDEGEEPFSTYAQMTTLPNESLEGEWESLIFEDPIPLRLLRCTTRMSKLLYVQIIVIVSSCAHICSPFPKY